MSTTPAASARCLASIISASLAVPRPRIAIWAVTSASGSRVAVELAAHAGQRLLARLAAREQGSGAPRAAASQPSQSDSSMPCAMPCGWSQMKASLITARMPTRSAALAAADGSSTVPASRKQVVPLRIISIEASTTARYSSSSLTVLKNTLSKVSKASVSASWSGSAPRNELERRMHVALDEAGMDGRALRVDDPLCTVDRCDRLACRPRRRCGHGRWRSRRPRGCDWHRPW